MNTPHQPLTRPHRALADAAICIWDALTDGDPLWDAWRDDHGSLTARDWCVDHAHTVENLWLFVRAELSYDECFDFEFVPLVLATCVEWRGRHPVMRIDAEDVLRGVITLAGRPTPEGTTQYYPIPPPTPTSTSP